MPTPAELERRYSAPNYDPYPVTIVEGHGNYVFDESGRKILDMMAGYSSLSLGHCHPILTYAAKKQLDTLTLTSRAYHNDVLGPLLEALCGIAGYQKAIPMNTGAKAVETAIKAARRWGHKTKPHNPHANIIVANGNFHGRTTTITSFSSDPENYTGFGPFTPGFRHVTYGNVESLANAIDDTTIAVLLEPIQGEAGIIVLPRGYFEEVRQLCYNHGALLIIDEIQSGLGRTGEWFAFEHENIRPDGIIVGKALGGGIVPISAFLADDKVMRHMTPGSHGSTFGGNPFAARIGLEVLNIMSTTDVIDRAEAMGEYMLNSLHGLFHPLIKEVRGRGLWAGVELHHDAREIGIALLKEGILTKDTHKTTLRFAPPFYITKREIDMVVEKLQKVLNSYEHEKTSDRYIAADLRSA